MNENKPAKKSRPIVATCVVLAAVIVIILLLLTKCGGGSIFNSGVSADELAKMLAADGDAIIQLDHDVVVDEPLTVNGNKTIVGSGSIVVNNPMEGNWPDANQPVWGMGCPTIKVEDATQLPAIFSVTSGASLTLGGTVTVDANGNANGVLVQDGGDLKVSENAILKNGRYANVTVSSNGCAVIEGGSVLDSKAHGIINYGDTQVTGGTVSGAQAGAAIYTTNKLTQSGGTVALANIHNIYVAEGTFTMTGGLVDSAEKDGVYIAKGATADVTGGDITNCNHGLCNSGTLNAGEVLLGECGIMNYEGGALNIKGTTVDTSEVYCLANNGGTVNAEDFTAARCDTCAIYNFAGDMNLKNLTVTGSRDGNIANAGGNLTVEGAVLDVCRDKSIVVGNGKAVMNNITINGTTGEKYGVYAYGGELYLSDSSIKDVSSTAVKVDMGGFIELNNVTIKDIDQNAFQSDGGKIVANNVDMENMGSHCIYNKGGDIIANNITIKGVKKNSIQHKDGNTIIDGAKIEDLGNHAAYIELGLVSVKNATVNNMVSNGFYLMPGENKLELENVSISGTGMQGVNNSSIASLKNVTISNTGMNGIYNKVGGVMTVDGLTVYDVAEHGVNNKAQMTISNVDIRNTGNGSNGIQNNGTMTLSDAKIQNSKNHGLYNNSKLTASNISISGTADNGVYNDRGDATIDGLTISNTTAQGVNNNSTIKLSNVNITNSKKNGIYVSKGTATVENVVISDVAEHGINNVGELTVVNADIKNTGAAKNGMQNSGKLNATDVTITTSQNHGVYNSGNFTASGLTISDTFKNGFFNDGGTAYVANLKTSTPGEHGVNNSGTMTLVGSTLDGSGNGSNCIQNKGTLTVEGVTLLNSKNHGIYNDNKVIGNGTLSVSGAAVNGIYNYGGNMDMDVVKVSSVGEHGINNAGTLEGNSFIINGVTQNGFQNNGVMTAYSATITNSGKHGIYNGKTFVGTDIVIKNSGDLLLNNGGNMKITGLDLSGTASKAIYNSKYAELYKTSVDGTSVSHDYLIDNNGGTLDLTDTTIQNARITAIHNRGKAVTSVTNVIIDHVGSMGIFVEGGSQVSGDGLVVNHVTKQNGAKEAVAIKLQGNATMMDHVILGDYDARVTGSGAALVNTEGSTIGGNALQIDAETSTYSGYDLVIKNCTSSAIYDKGKVFITDFTVENSGYGIAARYNGWATLSGNVTMKNLKNNPIRTYGKDDGAQYSNGITLMPGTNMYVDTVKSHGINNKGSFLAAADTTLTIKNVIGRNINAINNNTGTMTLGDVLVDGVYVTVSMYNSSTINSNCGNGIQTNNPMEINGDVVITNQFLKADNNKTDNSNGSGVVVKGNGKITGTGSISVVGVLTPPEEYTGYTSLYNGIFIDKNCAIDLEGDVSVTNATNQGIYVANAGAKLVANNISVKNVVKGNGIYLNNGTGSIVANGDITIDETQQHGLQALGKVTAKNITVTNVKGNYQGVYVRDGAAQITADSITVKEVVGNGIYVNNASGKVTVTNAITVENVGGHGVSSKGTVTAGSISIKNAGTAGANNGIENSGTVKVNGAITIDTTTKRGLNSTKDVTAGSLSISNFAENGIQNSGTLKVTGAVTIDTCTARGHGIYSSKTVEAGSFSVSNVSRNGINNGGVFKVTGAVVVKNAVEGGIGNTKEFTAGSIEIDGVKAADSVALTASSAPGINHSGAVFTVSGLTSIKNIYGVNVNAIQTKGGTMTLNDVLIDGVYVTVGTDAEGEQMTCVGNGIYAERALNINGTATVTNVFTNVKNNTLGAGLVVAKTGVVGGSGTLKVIGTTSSNEAYPYGLNNGIHLDGVDEAATVNMTGNIIVNNAGNQGIYVCGANAALTASNVTISNAGGNGIYINNATGKLTVTNDLTITGGNNHGLSNTGIVNAGNITIDGVTAKNGIENPGTLKATNITVTNTVKGNGIHCKSGTVEATNISVSGTNTSAIFGEVEATFKAESVTITDVKGQALQVNHLNTVDIGTLTVKNCTENALRLWNTAADPKVTIKDLVADNCKSAIAAAAEITDADLSVGTVWHVNCTNDPVVNTNVVSGVGEIKNELPPVTAPEQVETPAPVVPEVTTPATEETTPATEETVPATEETTPATEETVPATEETTPVTEETVSEAEETTPATESTETIPTAEAEASAVEGAAETQMQPTTTEEEA